MTASPKPLAGVKVLDFGHTIMGPCAGVVFADLGADVIKIEPVDGDPTRRMPGFASGFFATFNRNKRSIVINLKDPDGRAEAQKLLETADVIVSNFRPGVAERYGLDFLTLKERFPQLIYTTNTAYGPAGERAKQPGYDLVVQAMSGLIASNPASGGGVPKRYAGVALVDFTAGHYMLFGIMCALFQRERRGLVQAS